jgi:glycosyltransferase involved in cell wall biosynthesis
MAEALVSIIIPTHNRCHLLQRAVGSVLRQTYREIECIVVDDCSSDATRETVGSFADDRIVYLRNKENAGPQVTRNRGIQAARGSFVAFLDDDDEWLPEKLEKQVALFSSVGTDVGVVYCGYHNVSEKSGDIFSTIIPQNRGNVFVELLSGCILGSPTPLVRRHLFDQAGLFDEALSSCQDWDMWIRLARFCHFDFVPEALAKHSVHGEQISTDLASKIASRSTLLQKYAADYATHPRILSQQYLRLGVLHSLSGDFSHGRRCTWAALKLHPLQKSGLVHAALSLVPGLYIKILRKKSIRRFDDIIFYY